MENTFFYQSFTIRFNDKGNGTPVMLLHGFGEDKRIFDGQVDHLAKKYRLIVPDLPGTGESRPTGPNFNEQIRNGLPSDIDLMADSMIALMQSLNVHQYILLGHSMGGYIALAMAEKLGEKLLAFGLIHSTAFADTDEKKATRRKGMEFIERNGGFAFLQTSTPGLFTDSFKESNPGEVAALIEQFNPAKSGSSTLNSCLTAYYVAMINRPDRTEVLKNARVPVLFIIGTEDKAVLIKDVLKQSHLPKMAYVHILENTAHMSMMEKPDILNTHLDEFIENNKAS